MQENNSAMQENNAVQEDRIILELEKENEQYMMDLRETLNLSFKVLHAMEEKDYALLESLSSSDISLDKKDNQVVYFVGEQEIRMNFLTGIHLGNLEYRGGGYSDNNSGFQIYLAHYFEDTHGTIYFDFIKKNDRWLFNGFMTNA